jgi:hypothetical protein
MHLLEACISTDVHLIGIYLTGMHLTGVYLTGVHLVSHKRTYKRIPYYRHLVQKYLSSKL